MVSVSIEGRAGQMLGKNWKLHVGTVGEAIKALRANAGSVFEKALGLSRRYVIVVDGVPVETSGCFLKRIKKSLCFIPVLAGGVIFIPAYYAIAGAIIATGITTSLAIAGFIAVTVIVTVTALIVYGIYALVSLLNQDDMKIEGTQSSSFLFHGPENVASQGGVVPVGYGRLKTGSKVVSVSSSNVDRDIWDEGLLGVGGETVVRRSPLAPSKAISGGTARSVLIQGYIDGGGK